MTTSRHESPIKAATIISSQGCVDTGEPKRATMHPITQGEFVGTFTFLALGGYSVILLRNGQREFLPPAWPFYTIGCTTYILCWILLYLEGFPTFFRKSTRRLKRTLQQILIGIKTFIFHDVVEENDVDSSAPIPRWRPPIVEMHSSSFRYPRVLTARVQVLGMLSIFLSCWFTLYSGGPFRSAYSQIIIAYPLFAPNVARSWKSIAAVYAATGASMVLFEIIEQVFMPHQQTQSVSWYYVVTLILLCLSGAVAALNRRYDHARRERDAAYVRDVTLKTKYQN